VIALLAGDSDRILREVGRAGDPVFRSLVPGLVTVHQPMAALDVRLLPLCVKRSLLDVRLGESAGETTWQDSDIRHQDSDEFKALTTLRETVEGEIQAILTSLGGSVAVGQLATPEALSHYM